MATVELADDEWQQIMNALIAQNPLLMKVANQLREQQVAADEQKKRFDAAFDKMRKPDVKQAGGIKLDGDGKEIRS